MRFLPTLVCSLAAVLSSPAHAEPKRGQPIAVLTGEVRSAVTDQPISGAHVALWEAFPREGPGYYCPGCYRDCGRSTTTDDKGVFTLDHLDDSLMFKVLVTAEGYSPLLTEKSQNPALGPKVGEKALRLRPRDWSLYKPRQLLHGRVIETNGQPIAGAIVEAWGATNDDGSGMFGAVDGLDPLAVTAKDGTFKIGYTNGADLISITITAPGLARAVLKDLATGDKVHELALTEGAAISGRLTIDGKPAADIEVGLYDARRFVEDQSKEDRIATDKNGRFSFAAIRPNRDYWVYTKMDSAKKLGAAAMRRLHVGADSTAQDIGDLEMTPGFRVAGRLVTADGQAPPAGRVFLSNDDAWDDQIFESGPDGEFYFLAVPAGKYDLNFSSIDRANKLTISSKNAGIPFQGAARLEGRVDADITGLQVLLAPPEPQQNHTVQQWEKPLEGVEP
jgi:protocatechuate 3,4-dioxygenase beta subunit